MTYLMPKTIRLVFSVAAILSSPANSQELSFGLDGLSQFAYDTNTKFALGDSVSSLDLSVPKQRCLSYTDDDVKPDALGAINSKLTIKIVKDYEDAERQLNFSYSYQASAKVSLAKIISGDASLETSGSLDSFFKQEKDSLLLVLEASAEHGRDYISNFQLGPKYQKLLDDGKNVEFQQQCGTHFIRAVTRTSKLRVTFTFSDLTKTSKDIISQKLVTSGGVSIGIGELSAGAKSELSLSLSTALGVGSKLGRVNADVSATGGSGIDSLGKILNGANLSNSNDISKVLDGIVAATSDFTRKNSAPDQFILIPYPQMISKTPPFNSKQYDKLGAIYRALLRVDAQRQIYAKYEKDNQVFYEKYFKTHAIKLDDVRKLLVNAYVSCRKDGSCDNALPAQVDGIFLDDILFAGELRSTCPASYAAVDSPNAISSTPVSYVSSFLISWRGKIRYLQDLDFNGTEMFRITPELTSEKIFFRPDQYLRLRDNSDGTADLFLSVYGRGINQNDAVKRGEVDYSYLMDQRKDVARSIFVARFTFKNSLIIEQPLGMPNMSGCQLIGAPQQ